MSSLSLRVFYQRFLLLLNCAVVDCGSLDDPANGEVMLAETTFGSIANYTCMDGHGFPGLNNSSVIRECLVNGSWTGSEPTCRKLNTLTLELSLLPFQFLTGAPI